MDQNKENQRILAQAIVKANDKSNLLEKQTVHLYTALMAKHPQQQTILQDTTASTIKALTDNINRLESGSGGRGNGGGSGGKERGQGQCRGVISLWE